MTPERKNDGTGVAGEGKDTGGGGGGGSLAKANLDPLVAMPIMAWCALAPSLGDWTGGGGGEGRGGPNLVSGGGGARCSLAIAMVCVSVCVGAGDCAPVLGANGLLCGLSADPALEALAALATDKSILHGEGKRELEVCHLRLSTVEGAKTILCLFLISDFSVARPGGRNCRSSLLC